jgi:hypothetical protein
VTTRLLAREPENRYQSADELVEDLERVVQGQLPVFYTTRQGEEDSKKDRPPTGPSTHPGGPGGNGPSPPPFSERRSGEQPWQRRVSLHLLAAGLLGVVLLGVGIFLAGWLFSEENSSETPTAGGGSPLEEASTPGYALAKDNTGKLSVEVPSEWSAIDGTAWDFRGGKIGLGIIATNDLDSWYQHNYYHEDSKGIDEAPGVLFGVSKSLVDKYPENTEDQILNLKEYDYTGTCDYDDRYEYDDGIYKGKYDIWTKCGETNANVFVLAALTKDRAHVAVIQITAGSEADLEARKHVLDTFKVADDL